MSFGTAVAADARAAGGILPLQRLSALIDSGAIQPEQPPVEGQLQPASLDLRLGAVAYRVRASFLPGAGSTVEQKIARFTMHQIDLSAGAVLERGCVYVVPLMERLDLPDDISGIANPKSSSGRLDVFTRLITDNAMAFDRVRAGYRGPLYAEIAPRTFSVLVRQGVRLSQLRLRNGEHVCTDQELLALHRRTPLLHAGPEDLQVDGGVAVTVDLEGGANGGLIGWKARPHTGLIDVDRIGHYDPDEYWEPIHARAGQGLVLNPDDFYILASREAVTIPPDYAAEMVAYDTLVGEFRVHYAGFFDPGFGWGPAGGEGTRAVLEVRSHDVPFLLEHGQTVGRLVYEPMTETPTMLYGGGIGSNYQKQTLALAKQFRR